MKKTATKIIPSDNSLEVPKLILVSEFAAMLRVRPDAIYGRISAGELRVVPLGKKHGPVRLYLADAIKWISDHTVEPVKR